MLRPIPRLPPVIRACLRAIEEGDRCVWFLEENLVEGL